MPTSTQSLLPETRFHAEAYQFLFAALRHSQRLLDRAPDEESEEEDAHISGRELLEGVRDLAVNQFGLMAQVVFAQWGITSTADFGRMVFEMVERGEMRKTDRDHFEDFIGVFDFEDAFDREYQLNTSIAFSASSR